MQVKRKIVSVSLVLMLTASLLGGCGKSGGSNTLDFSNSTLSGIITAVDGDKVTVSMSGGFGGGRMGDRGNGDIRGNQNEQAADDNTDAAQSTGEDAQTPPGIPKDQDEQTVPEMPERAEGERPNREDMENHPFVGNMMQGSSTFTLTITDESVLEDCTMDDIAEGSFITVTLGDNNTIHSITVMKLTNPDNQSTSDTTEKEGEL